MDGKKDLLDASEISLALDSYDDLFSSFDPRPYEHRALSQDFLNETERASRDKSTGEIELKFLIPEIRRNLNQEKVIKKRLREHFRKHEEIARKEYNQFLARGCFFVLLGILFMFAASFILFESVKTLYTSFLVTLLEPAGWFSFWEGLGLLIFESKVKKPKLNFYRKMSKSEITFLPY